VRGSVVVAAGGTEVLSGSQVTAGPATALLRLHRGGEVRICPNTKLNVSTSSNGSELMFAIGGGALELRYSLGAVADSVMTPDFRVQLVGPGLFHFAIGSNARGDTCIKPGVGNAASLIVTELMGSGTYQVKPDESVMFPAGHLANPVHDVSACGCPPPRPSPPPSSAAPVQGSAAPPNSHVEVDAPFIYEGSGQAPDISYYIAQVRTRSTMDAYRALEPSVLPPPARKSSSKKPSKTKSPGRFFRAIGAFFHRIFR